MNQQTEDTLPAAIVMKMEAELPTPIVKRIEKAIAKHHAAWKRRGFDYFYPEEGDKIVRMKRETLEWAEAANDRYFSGHLTEWYDHFTGQREPVFAYPNLCWLYLTFRDRIEDDTRNILWDYLLDGFSPEGLVWDHALPSAIESAFAEWAANVMETYLEMSVFTPN